MAKNSVRDWDNNPNNNTDIGGIDIDENCPPGNINNAIRDVMAQIRTALDNGDIVGAPELKQYRLTSTGTHNFQPKTFAAWVHLVGGGGAGGGGRPPATSDVRAGVGGSSGEFVEVSLPQIPASRQANVTVGVGGSGGTGDGGNGGASTYNDGTINVSGAGGIGGGNAESSSLFVQKGATAPYSAQVGDEVRSSRNGGQATTFVGNASFGGASNFFSTSGEGGGSPFGVGGAQVVNFANTNQNGLPGRGYGAGGSGVAANNSGAAAPSGGDGSPGLVVIYELMNSV